MLRSWVDSSDGDEVIDEETVMNAPIHTGLALSDVADPAYVLQVISEGVDDARQAGEPDWMGAVDALIAACVERNACFSSGEISTWIRTYRPDVYFSVTQSVGPHIRSRYQDGSLPSYRSGPVQQQSRETAGYSLAPVHTAVLVYGPDLFAIRSHCFELDVPAPGGAMPDLTRLPVVPAQSAAPVQSVPHRPSRARPPRVTGQVLPFKGSLSATVHADHRLCIPRRAFEALASKQRRTVRGGDVVYVSTLGDEICISLDPLQGARTYTLVTSRCRLLFAAQAASLPVHSHFTVRVTDDGLKLDMSSPL